MFKICNVFLFLLLIHMTSSCARKTPSKYYNIQECENEMLDAKDYNSENAIDRIVVEKEKRVMYLYKNEKLINTIPVSLGKNPKGTKIQEGDKRTPEGEYWVSRKLCSQKYYRSLCISYPSPKDSLLAKRRGLTPGGNITIHAQPRWNANGNNDRYMLARDWTDGCVAVTNSAMKDLWYAVREGVPITIR